MYYDMLPRQIEREGEIVRLVEGLFPRKVDGPITEKGQFVTSFMCVEIDYDETNYDPKVSNNGATQGRYFTCITCGSVFYLLLVLIHKYLF